MVSETELKVGVVLRMVTLDLALPDALLVSVAVTVHSTSSPGLTRAAVSKTVLEVPIGVAVVAFRQLSVPLGALVGVWLLGEARGLPKVVGVALALR